LQAVSLTSGKAYVLVQHMDPRHKSSLVELLSHATKLPVTEIQNDRQIHPNHVYVIPNNAEVTIKHAVLHLHPRPADRQPGLPIDRFLTSLAEDLQANAIGVILSGAASDGTLGLQAIKAAGGVTFVQDQSAEYTSMPDSAIRAGAADFVLPPAKIARAIVAVNNQDHQQSPLPVSQPEYASVSSDFHEILRLIESQTGVSMTSYKVGTLQRRIQRRLAVLNIRTVADYAAYITDNPAEATALYQDLLINVTSFFRDQPTLDFFQQHLLPELVGKVTGNRQLRIWVAGCASGEEAYSLAIVCREYLNRTRQQMPVKIFATDLNATAIGQARSGMYTAGALSGVSKELRERYFIAKGANYLVQDSIRDMCIFATHNLLVDPPFLSVDYISCANVLIYLKPTAQQKLLASFHFALKPGGFLALGASESVGASRSLFSQLDKRLKVYSRKPVPSPSHLYSSGSVPAKNSAVSTTHITEPVPEKVGTATLADNVLLSQFTPASVVIDSSLDIIQFRGSTSPYLEAAPGKASLNLFKMVRPGLVLHLRKAIRHVKEHGEAYTRTVHFKQGTKTQELTLCAMPLASEGGNTEPSILIVFDNHAAGDTTQERGAAAPGTHPKTAQDDHEESRILQLERELAEQQDEMRRLSEDHEIANEELQLANEEVRSSNEELQSLNEELETSSEELASTNEELVSMNQTLRASNEALAAARDYAEAIIATVREPLLVLSADLKVMIANNSFYRVFNATKQATEGSSLYELSNGQWRIPELQTMLEDILTKNSQFQDYQVELDLPGIGHRIMLLDGRRIQFEQVSDRLILLAIEDITERQQAQKALQATADRLQFMAEAMPQKVFTATPDGARDYFNPQWSEFSGVPIAQITGWGWTQLVHPDDLDETLSQWKHSVATGDPYVHNNRFRRADGTYLWHLSRARSFRDERGDIVMWVGSNTDIEDIVQSKQRSAQLERTADDLKRERDQLVALNQAKEEFINLASHQLRTPATGVKQYVGMLREGYAGTLTETQNEFLDQANESNNRQLRIIEDLLKVAQVDSGHLTLQKTATDLVPLVESILKEQATCFTARRQQTAFTHTAPSVIAPIDTDKIRMVLENLIDNASKYTHEGKRITVTLSQTDAAVRIDVTDEGVGISPTDRRRLFKKFIRLDNDMSVLVGGSGLGLYWAKKIVDLHGGSITVASTPGKGSTFTVTLPTDEHR
jgi:two-component system CheB/CheR fusion protein